MVLPGLKWAMVINGNLAVQWKTTIKGLVHMPAIILTHTAKSENTEDSIEIVGFWASLYQMCLCEIQATFTSQRSHSCCETPSSKSQDYTIQGLNDTYI